MAATAYRVGYRLLGDRSAAQDIAAETLARAFPRWARIRDDAEPWVVQEATNLALDAGRRQTEKRQQLIDGAPADPLPEQLEDPRPPNFGRAELAAVLSRAESHRRRRRRRRLVVTGAAVAGLALVGIAAGAALDRPGGKPDVRFTAAGGAIACEFNESVVICQLTSGVAGMFGMSRPCPGAVGYLTLTAGGKASTACTSKTWVPILATTAPAPGIQFLAGNDSLTCSTTPEAVTCRNSANKTGFLLRRDSYSTYGS